MVIEFSAINDWLVHYILPFSRIAGMILAMVVIGTRSVSPRIRLFLALSVTVVAAPMIKTDVALDLFSFQAIIQVITQTLIGIGTVSYTHLTLPTIYSV